MAKKGAKVDNLTLAGTKLKGPCKVFIWKNKKGATVACKGTKFYGK